MNLEQGNNKLPNIADLYNDPEWLSILGDSNYPSGGENAIYFFLKQNAVKEGMPWTMMLQTREFGENYPECHSIEQLETVKAEGWKQSLKRIFCGDLFYVEHFRKCQRCRRKGADVLELCTRCEQLCLKEENHNEDNESQG